MIILNNEICAELTPTKICDDDEKGIIEFMVKFDKDSVYSVLSSGEAYKI